MWMWKRANGGSLHAKMVTALTIALSATIIRTAGTVQMNLTATILVSWDCFKTGMEHWCKVFFVCAFLYHEAHIYYNCHRNFQDTFWSNWNCLLLFAAVLHRKFVDFHWIFILKFTVFVFLQVFWSGQLYLALFIIRNTGKANCAQLSLRNIIGFWLFEYQKLDSDVNIGI